MTDSQVLWEIGDLLARLSRFDPRNDQDHQDQLCDAIRVALYKISDLLAGAGFLDPGRYCITGEMTYPERHRELPDGVYRVE